MKVGDMESLRNQDSKDSWREKKKKVIAIKTGIQKSINDETNTGGYAAFSYIPCVGPVIALSFKRSQKLVKLHAQNALYLQGSFFSIWLCVWFTENLPIISSFLKVLRFVPFVTNALMYFNVIIFLLASAVGVWKAYQKKMWTTPFLYKFISENMFKISGRFKKGKNEETDSNSS